MGNESRPRLIQRRSVNPHRPAVASSNVRQTLVNRRCTVPSCRMLSLTLRASVTPSLPPWLFNGGRWSGPSRHLLGGARSSQTPAHAAPCQPLPWLCRSRPSAAPSAVQARQPQPQTPPLRSRAGWFAVLRWGGRALSAANAGVIGAPSSPRFQRVGGFSFLVDRKSWASATPQLTRDALLGPLRESHSSARSRGLAAKKVRPAVVLTNPPGCGVSVSRRRCAAPSSPQRSSRATLTPSPPRKSQRHRGPVPSAVRCCWRTNGHQPGRCHRAGVGTPPPAARATPAAPLRSVGCHVPCSPPGRPPLRCGLKSVCHLLPEARRRRGLRKKDGWGWREPQPLSFLSG